MNKQKEMFGEVSDPDWQRIFGTSNARIEAIPKMKPAPLQRHQFEADLILTKPWLFGFGEKPAGAE